MQPEEWLDVLEMFLDFETSPEAIYDYPLPTTEEKAKEQVKVWSDSGYFYSVCLKGSSEVIGYLCFCGEQLREMGYSFKKKYQGQGYAQEAAQEMIAQMKQMGVKRIIAELALENLPSRKLIERLGFTQIGKRTAKKLRPLPQTISWLITTIRKRTIFLAWYSRRTLTALIP